MKSAGFMVCALAPLLGLTEAQAEPPSRAARPVADAVVEVGNFNPELLAAEIFRASNEVRVKHGVGLLKPEPQLAAAAAGQAAMLAMRVHSGHDNPLANHGDPFARVLQEGLPPGLVAENAATLGARNRAIGRNYTYQELAAVIVQAWMDSPGHRVNLLNPLFQYLGCGTRAAFMERDHPTVYAIQDFYTPAPKNAPREETMQPGALISR